MEAYVEDMVVKTKRGVLHLDDLEETFSNLAKFNLKLNPMKCTFWLKSRKFLSFITSERGIEENPKNWEP